MNQEIRTIEELSLAVEAETERMIFRHAHLISEAAQRETWARGLSITVLQGQNIVEIAPDGSKKIVGKSEKHRWKVVERKFTLNWKKG